MNKFLTISIASFILVISIIFTIFYVNFSLNKRDKSNISTTEVEKIEQETTKNNLSIFSNKLLFEYPKWDIDFAWETLPSLDENYDIKNRFDKEFLSTWYNLYQFLLYVKRLPLYMPYIEEKLEEYNIPNDFKYLAIAESALRNDVVSSAGAGGIWQFMPGTARDYDLIVWDGIDERYNFEKATDAAMQHIVKVYDMLGNWTLVAGWYNMGQYGIQSALNTQEVDNYYDLYLNDETSRYVFRILAIKYIMQNYEKNKTLINLMIGWQYKTPDTEIITLWEVEDLNKWAIENGHKYLDIKNLNEWIIGSSLPEWEWRIRVLK